MSVLLTGANGFIGSNLLEYLLSNTDWLFTCICSGHSDKIISANERVTMIDHDLNNSLPEIGNFEYILHLASDSHVPRSINNPAGVIINNVKCTLTMLEYARLHKPLIFVMFSTDGVYGSADHLDWDILLPSNPYTASKAAQEVISISYWKTYGVPVVITNCNNIFGKNQHNEKFIPMLIDHIKHDREVEIHVHNGIPGRRYWNPVENVVDAIKYILTMKPRPYGDVDRPDRYSITGGMELNNLEIAELIAKLLGKKLMYKLVDVNTVRPGYDMCYQRTAGTLELLEWTPPVTLIDGLVLMLDNIK